MPKRSDPNVRSEIADDLLKLGQKWALRGMPLLVSILHVVGMAYQLQMEGYIHSALAPWKHLLHLKVDLIISDIVDKPPAPIKAKRRKPRAK